MVRVAKSLQAQEQGYPHRDHRTKKRHRKNRVERIKVKRFKEKKLKRTEAEIDRDELKQKLNERKIRRT
jgi:hypothetical protein